MLHTSRLLLLTIVCLLCGSSCATTTGTERTGGPQGYAQTPAEARKQVRVAASKYPGLVMNEAGPASLAEAVEILRSDDFFRFDATSSYLSTQPGVDALTLRAMIEYATADVDHSLGKLLEQRTERDREAVQLAERQKQAGTADAATQERAAQLKARAEDGARVARALNIMYEHHLGIAKTLSEQAMAEYTDKPGGFLVRSGVARLERDWLAFDTRIQQAEGLGADPVGVLYMQAMDRLDRFADIEGAITRLRDVLTRDPGFVRAQAKLVLTAQDVERRHAELQALRALSPQHLMVAVLGPGIDEEYRVAMEIRSATHMGAAPAPAVEAAPAAQPAPAATPAAAPPAP